MAKQKTNNKKVSVTKGHRLSKGYETVKGEDRIKKYSKGHPAVNVQTGNRLVHGYEVVEAALDKKYADGGIIKSMEDEIKEIKEGLASGALPEAIVSDMKELLSKLEKDLGVIKEKPAAPKKAAPKKEAPKKAAPKKAAPKKAAPKKAEKKPKFGADKTCDELKAAFLKRRADAVKSGKKRKTISVAESIGTNLAKTVGKVMDSIPKADIKESPKKYITALENLEQGVKASLTSFKAALGDEYDRKEMLEPITEIISKFVKNVKEKYGK